jgi:hypothetical protein
VRGLEALQVDMVLAVRPVVSRRVELEVDLTDGDDVERLVAVL